MSSGEKQRVDIDTSRRHFLVASASASLVMAFAPSVTLAKQEGAAERVNQKRFSPTVWFEIDTEGKVLVNIAKAEMGQHVGTALARIVADELGANWDDIDIKHVDTDPKWGYMVTGGSWSVSTSFQMLSQAGAAGRIALVEAGAKLMSKKPEQCRVEQGFVVCQGDRTSFADIVRKGEISRTFTEEELAAIALKPSKEYSLIGKASKALDIPEKINGTAQYGIDVEIPGMIYARPIVPPTRYGNTVKSVDDSKAKSLSGYIGYKVLVDPSEHLHGWISVLADNYYTAIKAVDLIKVDYALSRFNQIDEQAVQEHARTLIQDEKKGALLINDGNVSTAKAQSKQVIEAEYTTSTVSHFQLEPVNATTEYKDGKWIIHTGNQWQSLTLPAVAKALGVTDDKVVLKQYYLGGGFGRRLFGDYAIPSALTAKAVGMPVKMVFTREDDSMFAQPRSSSVSHFKGTVAEDTSLLAVEHTISSGWPTLSMAPGFLAKGLNGEGQIDMFSASGADHWYSLPNHKVRVVNNSLANETFLPGWLRSVGPGWVNWGVESFMDELAHANGIDPVQFRSQLLDGKGKQAGDIPKNKNGALRLKRVLTRVAEKAEWGRALPEGEGLGIALTYGQERTMPTWVGVAAHVKVDKQSGEITLKKLWAVTDCGKVVHPDGAMAQMEGSLLWGVSLALHEQTKIENGHLADLNLTTYSPLRMDNMPELDIEFVESDEVPVGLGEPGVVAVAPAVGNAIYNAVGVRLRSLPMQAETLKAQLI
ncbi:xanthine dehydrogenase family protein molybdopterin-binding subunit [Alteromonas sp. a30]|uniref:xanthine dehydrogenase family protein molybdopterin-binding subunit n=1 Tax=Alteromonas sp. a30 TaxID=2730917 RepID=UPI00227DCDD7|nr:molybdopterin cofactor-binding domain-containing protein [Alteromonas sp. a30]MCY7297287.1 xanthine dehydrogenase family protein molybdopterin-binding subunit [Alteromonas sp. a30]